MPRRYVERKGAYVSSAADGHAAIIRDEGEGDTHRFPIRIFAHTKAELDETVDLVIAAPENQAAVHRITDALTAAVSDEDGLSRSACCDLLATLEE